MIRKSITVLLATSLLGGCMAFRGPEPVLLQGNVTHNDRFGQRSGHLYERFRLATQAAAGCAEDLPEQRPGRRPAGSTPPGIQCPRSLDMEAGWAPEERRRRMEAFMNAGFELVYAECADYFDAMGRRQRGTRVLSATLQPISILISGLVGLTRTVLTRATPSRPGCRS